MNHKGKTIATGPVEADGTAKAHESATCFGRLAESADAATWFARVGQPLTPAEARDSAAYLGALAIGDRAVTILSDWPGAAAAVAQADWRHPSWRREIDLQAALFQRAIDRFSSSGALLAGLTIVTGRAARRAGEVVKRSVVAGDVDPALVPRAVGAAAHASHQMALAEAAAAPADHAFAAKYRLFMAGRWPIGVIGKTLVIF